jgi:hypothetical protein
MVTGVAVGTGKAIGSRDMTHASSSPTSTYARRRRSGTWSTPRTGGSTASRSWSTTPFAGQPPPATRTRHRRGGPPCSIATCARQPLEEIARRDPSDRPHTKPCPSKVRAPGGRTTYKIAFTISLRGGFSGRPSALGSGSMGSTNAYWASVRSDGYPRRGVDTVPPWPSQPLSARRHAGPHRTFSNTFQRLRFERYRFGAGGHAEPRTPRNSSKIRIYFPSPRPLVRGMSTARERRIA